MNKIKRFATIMSLALLVSMSAHTCFAGEMQNGVAGPTETPGLNGIIHTGLNGQVDTPPATNGQMETPRPNGEISAPGAMGEILTPGLNGWMSTGLYMTIVSLFG